MMTAQYQAALHSYAEGRYEEAMQQFSELLYEDPRNPKLHIWLGATFRKAGKIEYAKVQYQQVLTLTDDPDLLDLASTSLAQIQNKLATIPQKSTKQKKPRKDGDKAQEAKYRALQPNGAQNANSKVNGASGNRNIDYIIDDDDQTAADSIMLAAPSPLVAPSPSLVAAKPESFSYAQINGNGIVPPPPTIATLLKNPEKEDDLQKLPDEQPMMVGDGGNTIIVDDLELTDNAPSTSNLNDTIVDIQKTTKITKKGKSNHIQVESPPVESVFLGMDDHDNPDYSRRNPKKHQSKSIALEDMFKVSTFGQKITLLGALVATIPAIALGVAAYQVGDSLLLNKVRQGQQSEAIALANATKNFLNQQADNVGVLQKLLVSTEISQNTLQKTAAADLLTNKKPPNPPQSFSVTQERQYKQQLTNRLNLYSQAYPEYTSIAVFSPSGELLAQSTNSKSLQILNPNDLSKVSSLDKVLLSNSVIKKDGVGANLYAITAIKSPASQKISMILQVEIPVKRLEVELTSATANDANGVKNSSFYVIDSSNKYLTSSQPVTVGEDALADFSILPDLRSSQSSNARSRQSSNPRSRQSSNPRDLVKRDRNVQILAYAPVPNMQAYGMSTWDVLTTLDKATAITGSQNLLVVIGLGIAATPLLVGAIAYALSRKFSTRLKNIRRALRNLRRENTDVSFETLSVEGNDELSDISLSVNRMSEQFQTMIQKHEQEKQNLQLQVAKLFKVLAKLAREEKHEVKDADLSDENILNMGKKVRAEMVQRHAEVESYRKQKEELQEQLMHMLGDVQALADGDLTVSTKAIDGNFANVGIFFDDVIRGLQNIVGQVKSSTNQVNFSLGQNEQAIANLASLSQRQMDTVTRSLNTMQMSKLSANTIVNHSQQVVQSSQLVAEKLSDSDRSIDAVMAKVGELQSTVSTTAKRVKHLGVVSQKIAKAISSINEIAIKTNFLAINATLEASRSGDASNRFVMVAGEVGELAARSVVATKEVENLLRNIQSETNAVMTAVESGSHQISESNTLAIAAKDSLQQIAQLSQQIDGLMATISEANSVQAQTSEGVANLMSDISHMAKRTLASSSEASQFIKATRQYSGELQQSLTHFKTR
jgi:twitching motility protein PilJ